MTPQTNEAFLREVDEELRLDTVSRIWKRWGVALIAGLVLGLIAFAGYLWWSNHRNETAGVEGENLTTALTDLGSGSPKSAEAQLKPLTTSSSPGYAVAAKMALADQMLVKDDTKGAAAAFGAIADDTSLAKPFRDVALVRQVAAAYDTMTPEQVVARLKDLAVPGNPWFGSAGEMTAAALVKMNKPKEAGAMYAAMVKDESVPDSIRSRSIQLAGVLGVDVTPPKSLKGGN